jgi:EAL domain-containing protein (putative c-di-GMP-specific phosphodiesterase class I)
VARLGADDFVIVMPDCTEAQAQRVAARVGDALGQPFAIDGQPTRINVHLGIASFPDHGQEPAVLLQAAETALLVGREGKRRISVFDVQLDSERERRMGLLTELRRALDGNELRLVYQPKVALTPDPQLRVEALVRWEHPERGLQNPADFIGFAERTGFIRELTGWVVDHSLRQIVKWRTQGMDVQVGVNLSAVDVRSADLATTIIERLRHYQLPAACLTVEISQAALELEDELILDCLRVLDRFGVKLALDDFTGGVQALALLDRLPVRTVKIERAMLSDLPKDQARQVLVKASIQLAHHKGLQVMAEGVEDAATLALLRTYGCDFAQGYYFGKPLASDALHAWVDHQMRRFQPQPPSVSGSSPKAATSI